MKLAYLTAFTTVAKHMNVTRAARELHTSQPSLSRHIQALEYDYKTKLFIRKGRVIDLTEDGVELLKQVQPILERLKQIEESFLSRTEKTPPTLFVGGTYAVSIAILPSLLALFKRHYPNVDVVVRSNNSSNIERLVAAGSVEIGFSSLTPRGNEFFFEPCVQLKLVAFAAKGFAIPKGRELTLANLEKLPLIIRDIGDRRGTTHGLLRRLREQGYRPNVLLRCESPEAIKAAVKKQMGIGILFQDIVSEDIARGDFKLVQIPGLEMVGTAYVIHDKERPLSPCGKAFLDLLRQWCDSENRKPPVDVWAFSLF